MTTKPTKTHLRWPLLVNNNLSLQGELIFCFKLWETLIQRACWEIAEVHVKSFVPKWATSYLKKWNLIFYLFAFEDVMRISEWNDNVFFLIDKLCSILRETSSVRVMSLLHCSINWSSSPLRLPHVNNYLKKYPSFPSARMTHPVWLPLHHSGPALKRFPSSSNHSIIAPLHLPAHNSFSATATPPLNWSTSLGLAEKKRVCHCSSSLSIAWLTAPTAWRVAEELLCHAFSPYYFTMF